MTFESAIAPVAMVLFDVNKEARLFRQNGNNRKSIFPQ